MKQLPLLGTLILSTAVAVTSCTPEGSRQRDEAQKTCFAWMHKGSDLEYKQPMSNLQKQVEFERRHPKPDPTDHVEVAQHEIARRGFMEKELITTRTVFARLCDEDKEVKQFAGKENSAVIDGTFDHETSEFANWKTIKLFPY